MPNDPIGDRFKAYERVYQHSLTPNSPVVVRVDGKAFHGYTSQAQRPFDEALHETMVHATVRTAEKMAGFKLAYTASDEASFLITDYDRQETEGWFGYKLEKIVSVTASIFTGHFIRFALEIGVPWMNDLVPAFDARAFVVPEEDAPNYFVWRQKDWSRNSLSMLARAHYSHKELLGKRKDDMHEMLHAKGVNWAHLPACWRNGTYVMPDRIHAPEEPPDYGTIYNTILEKKIREGDLKVE